MTVKVYTGGFQHTRSFEPVSVDLYDESGIGGGASGVSGGLLHPYSPKGLLYLWCFLLWNCFVVASVQL